MYALLVRQWIVFISIIAVGLWGVGVVANANPNPKVKRKQLETVRAKIKSVQQSLDSIQIERNSVVGQLKTIERDYGKITKSLRNLQAQTAIQRRHLKETKVKAEKLRASVNQQSEMLAVQLRSAYLMGRENRLKLVLNQEDPARINRLLVYYDYLHKARVLQLSKIQQKLGELGRIESEHLQESARLIQMLERKKSEQQRLGGVRLARKQVVAQLEREVKNKGDQLSQLRANERQLTELLLSLQRIMDDFPLKKGASVPFHQLQGRLTWPIKGKLIKRFGAKRRQGRWDGVLIGAQEGTPVRAISSGRIAYSDWLRGYGLLTIMDHGDGYMTLYAFNQSLYKEVGEWVETGEVIAGVGRSGGRLQTGLYFGIRKRGEPINPVKWCQRVRGGRVG